MSFSETILHINVTDFLASIAIINDPRLKYLPFVVASPKATRPIVLALSRYAYEEGIHSGMPLTYVQKRFPSIPVVEPDIRASSVAQQRLYDLVSYYTPTIQNDAKGHLFFDLKGTSRLFGPPADCAMKIRKEVQERIGFDPSIAIATNKLVAKVGSRTVKPQGTILVREGDEESFLSVQSISLLPGIGSKTERLLSLAGVREIGTLVQLPEETLATFLGKRAHVLRLAAQGIDNSPLYTTPLSARTITRWIDFPEPIIEEEIVIAALIQAIEGGGFEMRQQRLSCKEVSLQTIWQDGTQTTVKTRSSLAVVHDSYLIKMVRNLIAQSQQKRLRITSMILQLGMLEPLWHEPELFTSEEQYLNDLMQVAVDTVRKRFGVETITRASAVRYA